MKKQGMLLVVVILIVGLLAACGGGGNNTGGQVDNNKSSGDGTGNAVNEAPREVHLSFMLKGAGRFKDQYEQYLAQFTEKQLAEKNIKLTYDLELPTEGNLLNTRLASGEPPDIYLLHAVFDGDVFHRGGYLPDLSNEPFVDKLFDDVREVVTIDGKVFGVPLETFSWSYLYNKDIFNDLNLDPPSTLDEMEQVIETLHSNGITPFMLPYGRENFPGWTSQLSMSALAANYIPDWWDRMAEGEASLHELKDIGMFDIIDLVNANGPDRALEIGQDDGLAYFAQGEGAMLITGPWYADAILDVNPDFNLGLAGLPVSNNPNDAMVMLAVSNTLTVHPQSPNKDVAIDFLNYVLDDQDSSAFFESMKFNKIANNQDIDTFPWTADGIKYIEKGLTYLDQAIPPAPNEALQKLSQLYYSGQITQDELVDEMDKIWKRSIELIQ